MEGPGSDVKSSWGPAVAWALLCPPHMDGPHTAPCAASSLAPLELTPCPPARHSWSAASSPLCGTGSSQPPPPLPTLRLLGPQLGTPSTSSTVTPPRSRTRSPDDPERGSFCPPVTSGT